MAPCAVCSGRRGAILRSGVLRVNDAENLYHRRVQGLPSFRINEIFLSVQGEGLHVGERTVFVRFYGCVLRCVWCDQPEALAHTGVGEYVHLSPEEVRDRVLAYPFTRRVCLTGGEPVIAPTPGLLWLVRELKNSGYWVSIETSGARVVEELFDWIDFWTVAPKGTSAETFEGDVVEAQVPTLRRYQALPDSRRQFKFVIQTREDVADAVRILDELEYRGAIVLQPEHDRGDGRRVFEWWPWDRYPEARLIPQTHKIVGLR
ncbi:MAG: 7-carboxy-7-deazaguanine synthase QueE [Candidatus Eisenbacteria bacterium]|uniref:7-carboxy-7-deazaguanine synthase n=1 Tax=Eiseniibacteriota bacterium TaxID=2212470 RepID=A0A538T315_UNCEI|nr:MAG: 7-carboxy-7-deazaguanine synthase QueE [Candidatus Eisenbacteria bacterium]